MKKIFGILFILFIVNLDIIWAEDIKNEFDAESGVIVFEEKEAAVIKGEIPKPQALVTLPRKETEPKGDAFAPDMEKLLEELLLEN